MVNVKGIYINLKQSRTRRERIEKNLRELNINDNYSRFEAIDGNTIQIGRKNLNSGELGLWMSWMTLIIEAEKIKYVYDFFHFIEDDALLTKEFIAMLNLLGNTRAEHDIIVTDMYTNPDIFLKLEPRCRHNKAEGIIEIREGLYTGCTSSCLIRSDRINKVKSILEDHLYNSDNTLPLDNAILRLMNNKRISIASTIPFITSIELDSQETTTIQIRSKADEPITISQDICTQLRRKLSTAPQTEITKKLLKSLSDLLDARNEQIDEDKLTREVAQIILNEKLLRYKIHERLLGEENNPQKKTKG